MDIDDDIDVIQTFFQKIQSQLHEVKLESTRDKTRLQSLEQKMLHLCGRFVRLEQQVVKLNSTYITKEGVVNLIEKVIPNAKVPHTLLLNVNDIKVTKPDTEEEKKNKEPEEKPNSRFTDNRDRNLLIEKVNKARNLMEPDDSKLDRYLRLKARLSDHKTFPNIRLGREVEIREKIAKRDYLEPIRKMKDFNNNNTIDPLRSQDTNDHEMSDDGNEKEDSLKAKSDDSNDEDDDSEDSDDNETKTNKPSENLNRLNNKAFNPGSQTKKVYFCRECSKDIPQDRIREHLFDKHPERIGLSKDVNKINNSRLPGIRLPVSTTNLNGAAAHRAAAADSETKKSSKVEKEVAIKKEPNALATSLQNKANNITKNKPNVKIELVQPQNQQRRSTSPNNLTAARPRKYFYCNVCQKEVRQDYRKPHIMKEHPELLTQKSSGQDGLSCDRCNKSFQKQDLLLLHLKYHHHLKAEELEVIKKNIDNASKNEKGSKVATPNDISMYFTDSLRSSGKEKSNLIKSSNDKDTKEQDDNEGTNMDGNNEDKENDSGLYSGESDNDDNAENTTEKTNDVNNNSNNEETKWNNDDSKNNSKKKSDSLSIKKEPSEIVPDINYDALHKEDIAEKDDIAEQDDDIAEKDGDDNHTSKERLLSEEVDNITPEAVGENGEILSKKMPDLDKLYSKVNETSGVRKCNICSRTAAHTGHIKEHILDIHYPEVKTLCVKCRKWFKSGASIRKHLQSHRRGS